MAPLVNLISNVLWKIRERGRISPHELRNAVAVVTSDFKRQLRQHVVVFPKAR